MTYTDFVQDHVRQFQSRQQEFKTRYAIASYENWFYTDATGLFTFSTGGDEINFRYQAAGTFSRNTKTWKWAWDNEHIADLVKEKLPAVKQVGKAHGFARLTTGYFESTEEEAWQLVTIAACILDGIGVYRVVDEHLLSYKVLMEVVENGKAKKIKERFVECAAHEYKRRAFVCKHLNQEDKVGFEEAFDTQEGMELLEDDDFMAWCNQCEEVRHAEGEWNYQSMAFAGIRLVCEECYFGMKERNLGHR